jgi:hypothetical protein
VKLSIPGAIECSPACPDTSCGLRRPPDHDQGIPFKLGAVARGFQCGDLTHQTPMFGRGLQQQSNLINPANHLLHGSQHDAIAPRADLKKSSNCRKTPGRQRGEGHGEFLSQMYRPVLSLNIHTPREKPIKGRQRESTSRSVMLWTRSRVGSLGPAVRSDPRREDIPGFLIAFHA